MEMKFYLNKVAYTIHISIKIVGEMNLRIVVEIVSMVSDRYFKCNNVLTNFPSSKNLLFE